MKSDRFNSYKVVVVLLTAAFLASSGRLARAQDGGTGLNLVYVEENNAIYNDYIYGYINDGQGNLTPVPGLAYGAGLGVSSTPGGYQLDADHQVLINPEGTLIFAVNGHSNNVTEYSINADGSLNIVANVLSGGVDPAALAWKDNALSGNTAALLVVNKNSDPTQLEFPHSTNYAIFSVSPSGAAALLSSFQLPTAASPAQAAMFAKEDKFFGINFLENQVASYQVFESGGIKQTSTSTPPGTSAQVQGAAVHPTKSVLYVGLPNQNQIAIYTFDPAGNLTYASEFADPGQGVGWLVMNASGSRLYSTELGSGTITVYNTGAPGKPLLQQHVTLKLPNTGTPKPTNMAFDPTGQFLYVVDRYGLGFLHVLHVASDGTVSEPTDAMSLPFPADSVPLGVATVMK